MKDFWLLVIFRRMKLSSTFKPSFIQTRLKWLMFLELELKTACCHYALLLHSASLKLSGRCSEAVRKLTGSWFLATMWLPSAVLELFCSCKSFSVAVLWAVVAALKFNCVDFFTEKHQNISAHSLIIRS